MRKTCILIALAITTIACRQNTKAELQKSMGLKNSSEACAKRIIDRALVISDSIDLGDGRVRDLMKEALLHMKVIVQTSPSDSISFDVSDTFFLVMMMPRYMPGSTMDSMDGNTTLMSFAQGPFDRAGKIAVLVHSGIDTISSDMDVKATCLIHELIHALQMVAGRQNKVTAAFLNRPETQYANEKEAWDIQARLYFKLHPELLEGTTCDCATHEIYGLTTVDQLRLLKKGKGDRMVRSLALYRTCGEPFLKQLYMMK